MATTGRRGRTAACRKGDHSTCKNLLCSCSCHREDRENPETFGVHVKPLSWFTVFYFQSRDTDTELRKHPIEAENITHAEQRVRKLKSNRPILVVGVTRHGWGVIQLASRTGM